MTGLMAMLAGMADAASLIDTRLSTTDKHASISISGSDLVATATGSTWVSGRATEGKAAGKWYFEATPTIAGGSGFALIGLASAVAALNSYLNVDLTGVAYLNSGPVRNGNNTTAATAQAWTTVGQWVRLAVDLDNDRFWASVVGQSWNGSGTADPSADAGGIALPSGMTAGAPEIFPGYSLFAVGQGVQFNFGAAAFLGSVPGGFRPWNG